jgi:hypothetical protein
VVQPFAVRSTFPTLASLAPPRMPILTYHFSSPHLDDRPTGPPVLIDMANKHCQALMARLGYPRHALSPSFWIAMERLEPGDRKPYPQQHHRQEAKRPGGEHPTLTSTGRIILSVASYHATILLLVCG